VGYKEIQIAGFSTVAFGRVSFFFRAFAGRGRRASCLCARVADRYVAERVTALESSNRKVWQTPSPPKERRCPNGGLPTPLRRESWHGRRLRAPRPRILRPCKGPCGLAVDPAAPVKETHKAKAAGCISCHPAPSLSEFNGWQPAASKVVDDALLAGPTSALDEASTALLHSQALPFAGRVYTSLPTFPELLRHSAAYLRRLRLPLPPAVVALILKSRSACPRAGLLRGQRMLPCAFAGKLEPQSLYMSYCAISTKKHHHPSARRPAN